MESFIIAGITLAPALFLLWAWTRPPSRTRTRLILIGIVVLVLNCFWLSTLFPNNKTRDHGHQIAEALLAYRDDNGHFPEVLDLLVPAYIPSITQTGTLWGWLYRPGGDDFILGFAGHIDRDGYWLDVISSNLEWEMQRTFRGSFDLIATPFPHYIDFRTPISLTPYFPATPAG